MANADILQDLKRHFGEGCFVPLAGRGNSRVGIWEGNQRTFVKIYPKDGVWDRRAAEKRAIDYYNSSGMTLIPKLLHTNETLHYSVFSYIDGTPDYALTPDLFSQFKAFLHGIVMLKDADRFTEIAKEAFFHTSELKAHINSRRAFLRTIDDPLLQNHMCDTLDPAFAEIGYDTFPDVACDNKIIVSPSDFGTHNSMLTADGKLTFIDFEYAGRDSLFKLLGDIYWHPGSILLSEQRTEMIAPYLQTEQDKATFKRVQLLMGLKWSLLLLNEFIPAQLQKRIAASAGMADIQNIKQQQIEKSARILQQVLRH